MFLLDTDVLSNLIKRDPSARLLRRLASVPPEHQHTSAITVGELLYGAYRSVRAEHFLMLLDQRVWPHVAILPFDEAAARVYGRLRAELERMGRPASEPDLQIAAIALTRDLIVVTGNARHFEHIPDLRIEQWL